MKGLIFTSLIEYSEQTYGLEFVERMLGSLELSTAGAYTGVGTYPSGELLAMIDYLADHTDAENEELQADLGKFTFDALARRYPQLLATYSSSFECIYEVDQTIHRNVRKLYPDAELPNIGAQLDDGGNTLRLQYESRRPLMHFARGLLHGCAEFFDEEISVEMTDLSGGKGTLARFVIQRNG